MRCCSVEGDRSRFCVSVSLSTVHYRTQTLQNRALGNLPTTVHCASAKKKKKKEAHENRRERECACGSNQQKKKRRRSVCISENDLSDTLRGSQTDKQTDGKMGREKRERERKNRNTVFVRFVLFSAFLFALDRFVRPSVRLRGTERYIKKE